MGTALFTAVTGLRVHQRRLDVIANNVANVNTTGYRSSRVLFQDLFSQTLRGGTAPVGNIGGSNPQQVGLGVNIASIDVDHSQGSLQTTGISSDLAVQGAGFFMLSDGARTGFSRDGSFTVNSNGVMIEPASGMRVMGYMADNTGSIDNNAAPTEISIPIGAAGIVRSTTVANMIGNLNADSASGDQVIRTFSVYDSLGTERIVEVTYTKTPNANEWDWSMNYDGNAVAGASGTIAFDSEGQLDPAVAANMPSISVPASQLDPSGQTQPEDMTFTLDMTAVSQLSAGFDSTSGDPLPSDVTLRNQDGFPRGVLESFNIGANGELNGVFSNGLTRVIAQVALATFSNVGGLSRAGNNMFNETTSSGTAQVGMPGSGGRGIVNGGVLENSNVDLGREFSEMIITQRGYQANARTITTADTVMQETVNLVR